MAELLHRAFPADLIVRADQRTIVGLAVPWGEVVEVRDGPGGPAYRESFQQGAFTRTLAERGDRVKALVQHNRQLLPVGRATRLTETGRGLEVELRLSRTALADEVLALVADGALDSLSIGFVPVTGGDQWNRSRDTVTRTEVALREVSVVPDGAYPGARIEALRSANPPLSVELARARLTFALLRRTP